MSDVLSDLIWVQTVCEGYQRTTLVSDNSSKGSLTLAMGKCLWFSVKIKVCQLSLSSP